MESQNISLNGADFSVDSTVETQYLISVPKFILLSILSFGLYEIWWVYKAWRFYQQKEDLDIMPAGRALFNLFFLYTLLKKIKNYANQKGVTTRYSVDLLFIGYLVSVFITKLPNGFGLLLGMSSVLFLIPPFKALNFAKRNSPELTVLEQNYFSGRQIAVLVIGAMMWFVIIMGMISEL
ncbi:hypothetical protein HUW51_01715 [Adhaeribacter swui]|uniref:DUF4234 domain-containing protein n=1 Tax=Adhaeribacter swui TaxID=2086471 RepID=A0A7G7G2W8_9BACT|nr:hypothetical protein [Adhaeribacter swui]QNF31502.1 hypothetical protein HUW51_01715 [Adhaeribacter swui]